MVQRQFSQLRRYVRGIKTRVLLDSDISSPPTDVRCMILPGVASLSDGDISSVLSWSSRGDKSLVVVGASGVYEARSDVLRDEFPLQSAFGFEVGDIGSIGSWGVSFPVGAPILQGESFGSVSRFGVRRLESPGVYDATMFLATIDRSAFFNPDMFCDGGIDDVIWRLAAFGVSRGSVVVSHVPDVGFDNGLDAPSAARPVLPAGAVQSFALSSPPDGWLVCDGSNVSRSTYRRLFDAIGTTFGACNGSSAFTLPDLTGRVVVGIDADDASFDTLGGTGGSKTHALTEAEMPSHSHTYTRYNALYSFAQATGTPGIPNVMYNTSTQSAGTAGSGSSHNNLQPYMAMLVCIKT
jgi:microcystin-dependent protein